MPCDSVLREGQDIAARMTQIEAALKRLEGFLAGGQVQLGIGLQGAIVIKGWAQAERSDVTDACAVRRLLAEGSWAFRQAVARAEAQSGRKMNQQAAMAGVHSHDGGKTWSPGH